MIWAWMTAGCIIAAAGLGGLFVMAALGSAGELAFDDDREPDELDG